MKYLRQALKGYGREVVLAPLFKMLEAGFDLLVPVVVAHIVNEGIGGGDRGMVLRLCAVLLGMALVGLTCAVTAQYFSAKAAVGCASRLRERLFAHIESLGWGDADQLGASTLVTRMTTDINQVQNGVNMFLRLLLRSPFVVGGAFLCAFLIDSRIAWIFALAIAGMGLVVGVIMRLTLPRYRQNQARLDKLTGATRENLSGVRVIRAFGMESRETARFESFNEALAKGQLGVGHLSALMGPLTLVIVNLGIIAVLQRGADAVQGGRLLSGEVIALVNYMSQILVELVKLANLIVTISRSIASLRRVSQVLDTQPSLTYPETSPAPAAGADAVRFDHVSLRYPAGGAESLTDITFSVKRGETVGIIGPTGSGKSSLVHLIPRFYEATAGQVSLWGHPVSAYAKADLRRMVGLVPQRAQLFTGTVRSNLLWGNPGADDEMLWEALSTAQADSFIREKSRGLDEPVEQAGRNFSGGQRQRLTIARALAGQPPILILDDSASALDYLTDAQLRKALRRLPWEATVFIVSQRTASIRHADTILVMDDGRLVAQGTHEELLETCPVYREIHLSQTKEACA